MLYHTFRNQLFLIVCSFFFNSTVKDINAQYIAQSILLKQKSLAVSLSVVNTFVVALSNRVKRYIKRSRNVRVTESWAAAASTLL